TETTKGKFILRFFRSTKSEDEINLLFSVLLYLHSLGFPVHKTISTKKGSLMLEVEVLERLIKVAIFNFLPGSHIKYEEIKEIHLQEIGRMLEDLHEALRQFPPEKLLGLKSSQVNFQEELEQTDVRLERNFSENYFLLSAGQINFFAQAWRNDREDLVALSSKLETGESQLIHTDIVTDNLLFVSDKISGILDFDNMRMGLPLEDLAIVASAWFLNAVEMDVVTCLSAIIRSYKENYSLDEQMFIISFIRFYIWKQIVWAMGPSGTDYYAAVNRGSLKTFERKYKELSLLKNDDIFTN
ncbi:MAG: phosphotransferase, partial [Candidatus Cloacimonetes bacterium]|nr:phosphotransferase [Candidatus Cloacimonadota bacterium]